MSWLPSGCSLLGQGLPVQVCEWAGPCVKVSLFPTLFSILKLIFSSLSLFLLSPLLPSYPPPLPPFFLLLFFPPSFLPHSSFFPSSMSPYKYLLDIFYMGNLIQLIRPKLPCWTESLERERDRHESNQLTQFQTTIGAIKEMNKLQREDDGRLRWSCQGGNLHRDRW